MFFSLADSSLTSFTGKSDSINDLLFICVTHSQHIYHSPADTAWVLQFCTTYLTTSISNRSWWKDSSPQIAKALFLAIDPEYQRSGIGFLLNQFRDEVLVNRGVKRYDGIVEMHRIPQIHLLHKTGFQIQKRRNKFFVSKDLNGETIS